MPLALIKPGDRKGNPFYIVRGSVNGRVYEKSTGTADKGTARQVLRDCEEALKEQALADGRRLTFAQAVEKYKAATKTLDRRDLDRLDEWVAELGKRRAGELLPADFHAVAIKLHGHNVAATKNRFMRPAIAAWHYVADAGLITYRRVKLFREPPVVTRATTVSVAATLIGLAQTPDQRRLLVWLFHQGTRITATLRVQWAKIEMMVESIADGEEGWAGVVEVDVRKGKPPRRFALHPAVIDELLLVPKEERTGYLFPWRQRWHLRPWLPDLCERAGVHVTPHMARHTVGTILASKNTGLKPIMDALGHDNVKSSLRYQVGGIEMVRAAHENLQILPKRTA